MKVFSAVKDLKDGDIIEVAATDFGFGRDVEAWCKRTGNTCLKTEKRNNQVVAYIQKGTGAMKQAETRVTDDNQGKTIIVFSGDLDKVIAAFYHCERRGGHGQKSYAVLHILGIECFAGKTSTNVLKSLCWTLCSAR